MKINKFTSALIALGIVSLAGVAQANPIVYITGSTAARAFFYGAATTPNQIFTGTPVVISTGSANTGSGANTIVFEGNIAGVGTVDLDCSWTGSEAGIASVAGQTLTQVLPGDPNGTPGVTAWPIPNATPNANFLNPANWTTANVAAVPLSSISGAPSHPDLAMADSSQTVSQTSKTTYPLVDYGIVGIVPFTVMKGYEATPDTAWNNVVNITTAQINQILAGPLTANFVTGVAGDSGDFVAVCGRNLASGTRVDALLNFQYGLNTSVDQYAYDVSYPAGTPGVLTKGSSYGSGLTLTEVFNDGFDSGKGVQQVLNVDGTGSGVVLLGYLGLSDAANASQAPSAAGHAATYLPFNGVYESDSGVINGSYSYWGQEHLFGAVGQASTSTAGITATNITHGIALQLVSAGAGTKTGAVGPTYTAQSNLIPKASMQATRGTDSGFPTQGTFH